MKPMENMILRFVIAYITEHGYSPSFSEIGNAVALKSKSNVHRWITRMIENGILETDAKTGGTPRAIRVPGYEFVRKRERVVCGACGAEIDDGFCFCPHCGRKR